MVDHCGAMITISLFMPLPPMLQWLIWMKHVVFMLLQRKIFRMRLIILIKFLACYGLTPDALEGWKQLARTLARKQLAESDDDWSGED